MKVPNIRTRGLRLVAMAGALALAACGGNASDEIAGSTATSAEPAATTSTSVTTTTTTSPGVPFVPSRIMRQHIERPDGSSYELEIRLGEAVPYRDLPDLIGFDPPFGCSYDAERDAVIPGQLVLTSQTEGFSINVSANAYLFFAEPPRQLGSSDPRALVTVEGDNTYSNGADCSTRGDAGTRLTSLASNALQAGAPITHDFWIAVHDYLSPASPSGDPSVLPNLGLAFDLEEGEDGSYNPITQICGTDIIYNNPADLGEREFGLLPFAANHAFEPATPVDPC